MVILTLRNARRGSITDTKPNNTETFDTVSIPYLEYFTKKKKTNICLIREISYNWILSSKYLPGNQNNEKQIIDRMYKTILGRIKYELINLQ